MRTAGLLASACIIIFLCPLLLYFDQSCIIGVRWLDLLGSGFLCHLVLSVGINRLNHCTLEISACSYDLSEMFNVLKTTRCR